VAVRFVSGYTHPGCFAKRGWISLILKVLAFLGATKRLQKYENIGFSYGAVSKFLRVESDEADFDVVKLDMEYKIAHLADCCGAQRMARMFH
jgi:hypothetical protein